MVAEPHSRRVVRVPDVAGRTLRVSGHPEAGRVVLSIWQDSVCRATLRLAPEDLPHFVEMLTRTAVEAPTTDVDPATAAGGHAG